MPLLNNNLQVDVNLNQSVCSHQLQKVQLKKKSPIIKLQVNKLVKPKSQQVSITKNIHSYNSSHHVSKQIYDLNQSFQKQVPKNSKNNKIMNFQDLYFQKIKERRQQSDQTNGKKEKSLMDSFFLETRKQMPLSCKNSLSIKNKNKVLIKKQIQSTKNYNFQGNKENNAVQNQKQLSKTPPKFTQNKYFKKIIPLQNNLNILNCSSLDQNNGDSEKIETQKVRKVLKLKKKIVKTQNHSSFNSSIEKYPNHFDQRNSLCRMEKPSISPINGRPNLSEQFDKLRLSTPSQSTVSKNMQPSYTEIFIKQIIDKKIDHSMHEHVWSGVECFFSFQEFGVILKELGLDEKQSASVGFYVRRLWEHLGGDLFGGIVKKNMVQLLNIVLEEDRNDQIDNQTVFDQKNKSPLPTIFVESSSLKLLKFNGQVKDQIRTFYFPLRMAKIASKIQDSSINHYEPNNPKNSPNLTGNTEDMSQQSNIQLNSFETKETPKQKIAVFSTLENNPYLESVSAKAMHGQMSPCMIPISNEPSNESTVTDFSPKMSKQRYESFQSTVLQKQSIKQKLSTELSPQQQSQFKSNRKALLSIDINLGEGTLEKIVVYEDQDPYEVSLQLKQRYNIDEELRQKFQALLKNHLKHLLFKIQEVSQELFEDSLQLKDQVYQNKFIVMEKQSIF